MRCLNILLAIGVAAILQSSLALGQGDTGVVGQGAPSPRFAGAPEVGQQIPDVTIVDDQGNLVNIRELAGQSTYTVLTLGCLT
jgi:hypothetical protein